MKNFRYQSYAGEEEFLFIRCCRKDQVIAAACAEKLTELHRIRIFFDVCDSRDAADAESIAETVQRCSGTLFFLSADSCGSLTFRNSINYALGLQKPMMCIKIKEFSVAHGLDMQLANIPIEKYADAEDACRKIMESGIITQQMIGSGMLPKKENHRKAAVFSAVISLIIALSALSAYFIIKGRVDYYNSPAYLLRNVDGAEYVDISEYKEKGLAALKGMSVDTLSMKDGDFRDLSAVSDIAVHTVDVTGNPDVSTLWPLTQCEGIETVKMSQDMLRFAKDLTDAGIAVIVTR